MMADTMTAQTI